MQANKGFTLVELMVAISIVGIILSFAIPAAQTMQANSRMSSAANNLALALKKARSEAIIKRKNMIFKSTGSTWNGGWSANLEGQTSNFISYADIPLSLSITESNNITQFSFNNVNGVVLKSDNSVVGNLVFVICDNKLANEKGYEVSLNSFGRVLVQRLPTASTPTPCS